MLLVLGVADIIASVIMLAKYFNIETPQSMVIFFGSYLIIKALFFILSSLDWGSFIDLIGGLILIMGLFLALPSFLLILFGIIILIKGVISALS